MPQVSFVPGQSTGLSCSLSRLPTGALSGPIARTPVKPLYQAVLSGSAEFPTALQHLLKRTITEPDHYDFLLHRVNWFADPWSHELPLLVKTLRLHRGRGKEAAYVGYALLAENMAIKPNADLAVKCLLELVPDTPLLSQQPLDSRDNPNKTSSLQSHQTLLSCLSDTFPHKQAPIQCHLPYLESLLNIMDKRPTLRLEILNIIIHKLIPFDTELPTGLSTPLPDDSKPPKLRKTEIAVKLDVLLKRLLTYLTERSEDANLMNELLTAFQDKILPTKGTQCVQFTAFLLAEVSKANSMNFIALLLSNIIEPRGDSHRIYIQSHQYLCSYLLRSASVSEKRVVKIAMALAENLKEGLTKMEPLTLHPELVNVEYKRAEKLLIMTQTLLLISKLILDCHITPIAIVEEVLGQSEAIIHFRHFLRPQLLQKCGLEALSTKNLCKLSYDQKFGIMPIEECRQLLEPQMKSYMEAGEQHSKKSKRESCTWSDETQ